MDAGANGLNCAQRGKPVAKRTRFLQKEAKWTLGIRSCLRTSGFVLRPFSAIPKLTEVVVV